MANKRGLEVKDGKIYIDGVEYKAADDGGDSPSGPVHNTFNKICIYGTSIEANNYTWSRYMAENHLGLVWGLSELATTPLTGVVINFSMGGGGITWYDEAVPLDINVDAQSTINLWGQVNAAFSCTEAEKRPAMQYYVEKGLITQEMYNAIIEDTNGRALKTCYEDSILASKHIDADLFIFGTYGINDRHSWMNFDYYVKESKTIGGEEVDVIVKKHATSYTMEDAEIWVAKVKEENLVYDSANQCYTDLTQWEKSGHMYFERRTIFGAYNYVLRQLYDRKSDAKVVILGQHVFNWPDQDKVNEIQRAVAYVWGIPFADWGSKLRIDMPEFGIPGGNGGTYLVDPVHPSNAGCEVLGEWVADWITNTPLTSLNPNTNVLDLDDCPINPAMS